MVDKLKEILNQYIPNIIKNASDKTLEVAYNKAENRYNVLSGISSNKNKISAPSFVEYVIINDFINSEENLLFIKKIDTAFKLLLDKYPAFNDKLKENVERMLKATNPIDVFDNMLDWENLAIEFLLLDIFNSKGAKIKDIEYPLKNGKSIDVYINHPDVGDALCEFRSIHIDLGCGIRNSKIRKKVKDIVRNKIKSKTEKLDLTSLPAPLIFQFVIQIQNGAELPQDLLKRLNTLSFSGCVLPIMVCRLGRLENKDIHFEIVQIKDLIEK